jgi:hypothetical protein
MTGDLTKLDERRAVLEGLLKRVPARVMSSGVMVTAQYVLDVNEASKAIVSANLGRINEAILTMELWHAGEVPGYHSPIN